LNKRIFHMTKARLKAPARADLEYASQLGHWIDREWERWALVLPEIYKPHASASPVCTRITAQVGSTTPVATNHVTTSASSSVTFCPTWRDSQPTKK
jgi:hypothetical protein